MYNNLYLLTKTYNRYLLTKSITIDIYVFNKCLLMKMYFFYKIYGNMFFKAYIYIYIY